MRVQTEDKLVAFATAFGCVTICYYTPLYTHDPCWIGKYAGRYELALCCLQDPGLVASLLLEGKELIHVGILIKNMPKIERNASRPFEQQGGKGLKVIIFS